MGIGIRLNIALLIAALVAWPCFAETMADPSGISGIENQRIDKSAAALATATAQCNRTFAQHKCEKFKDDGNRINCSIPEGYAPAQIGLGCLKGGVTGIWNTATGIVTLPYEIGKGIVNTPSALRKHGEKEQRCMDDLEYKKSLLAPIQMIKGSAPSAIASWSCNQVRDYVENIARNQDQIISKKRREQERYEAELKARGADKKALVDRLHPEVNRKLTPEEEEYVKANEKRQKGEGALKDIIDKINEAAPCFTNQYKAKLVCQVLTEVVAGVATGVAVAKYAPRAIGWVANHGDDVAPAGPRPASVAHDPPPARPPTQANDPDLRPAAPRGEPEVRSARPANAEPESPRVPPRDADGPRTREAEPARTADVDPETQRPTARDADSPRTAPHDPERAPAPRDADTPAPIRTADDTARIERAEEVLGRKLSPREQDAILDAHKIGRGEPGRDGTPARVDNYTDEHIRDKALTLRGGGIRGDEPRKLMDARVVGDEPPRRAFTERPARVDIDEPVAVRRSNGGFSNGVVKEIDGDAVKVEFKNPDGTTGIKTVHRDHLRAALREGDEVGVPRTDGSVSRGTVHKVHDDGRADVRFTDNGVPKEKRDVAIDRLAPVPREAPPAPRDAAPARAVAERPDKPDFNWLKNSARTDDDIRHFLKHSDEAEFKKFMADYKPGMNPGLSLQEQRDLVRGHPNFVAEIDQKYIGANAPRGLPPPKGSFTNDFGKITYTADDGSRVGAVHYKHKNGEIHIDSMRTSGQYAGRGVGDQLLKQVIARNPGVTRYSAEMAVSNLAAVQRAIASGASPHQAIMQTPFYKSMNRLGFGRIIESNCSARYCSFVLGR